VWDINDKAKANFNGRVNKDDFVYTLMIRQTDFVSDDFYSQMLALAMEKKKNSLLEKIKLERLSEGLCVQMLHLGLFDDKSASFEVMEEFAKSEGIVRARKCIEKYTSLILERLHRKSLKRC